MSEFVTRLRRRKVGGSLDAARHTAVLLRQVVHGAHSADPAALIAAVRAAGARLVAACHTELSIGNVVRRVLHVIREEAAAAGGGDAAGGEQRGPSLATLLEQPAGAASDGGPGSRAVVDKARRDNAAAKWKVRTAILEGIGELIDELDGIPALISDQALDHVHANEVILTFGYCRTVHLFLREAAKKRVFSVVVAEGGPSYEGQRLAADLAADGIATTCITDSAVFALMARANMVLVGAHAVLANGGMLGVSGLHGVALAAQRHAVPFVVLTGLHKLAKVFPHDPDTTLNELRCPAEVLDFDALADSLPADGQGVGPDCHVANPLLDYIPPTLVALFITDTGCHCPSYVYRLLSELFDQDDDNVGL